MASYQNTITTVISLLLFSTLVLSQTNTPSKINGPLLKFDEPLLVDTIFQSQLDTTGTHYITKPSSFIFRFTNVGTEPLCINWTGTGDPDFMCRYPKNLVEPGKRDSIEICTSVNRLSINKTIVIQSNSIVPQSIHYIRINATNYEW